MATALSTGVKQGATTLYDPNGNLAGGSLPDTHPGAFDGAWHGGAVKLDVQAGIQPVVQMGARQYHPGIGRFLEVDPIEGGVDNDYNHVGDPINDADLTGMWSYKRCSNGTAWANLWCSVTLQRSIAAMMTTTENFYSSKCGFREWLTCYYFSRELTARIDELLSNPFSTLYAGSLGMLICSAAGTPVAGVLCGGAAIGVEFVASQVFSEAAGRESCARATSSAIPVPLGPDGGGNCKNGRVK